MKFAVLLLLTMRSLASAESGNRCAIVDGDTLVQYGGRELKLKVPCKFNAIQQDCGDYRVTVTPGQQYAYFRYIIDTIWLGVKNTKTGQFWVGRTTNKLTALYIIKEGKRNFFNKKNGTYSTQQLFVVEGTRKNVTIREKNNVFSLTVGAFDFAGNLHNDSDLEFVCNVENTPSSYPTHFCGSANVTELDDRVEELFNDTTKVGSALLYDIFTDRSIIQMKVDCKEVTRIMTEECINDDWRKEAIETCHTILDSDAHTKCVVQYACDPLDIFLHCVKYVCGNYTERAACIKVAHAIDLCPVFPILTSLVQDANCIQDLLTAEDNPFLQPPNDDTN